jgi:outer membrane protein TolC
MKLWFSILACVCTLVAAGQQYSLNEFIERARANSPLLKEYSNTRLLNQLDSLRIRATLLPQVSGSSTNNYAPVIGGWGYDNAITNGINFSQLITVSKDFVPKNVLANQFALLRLQNDSLALAGKVTTLDIVKSVTAQYITAYGSLQQVRFNQELLDLLRNEETVLKRLTEKAVYRQTDYLSFLVTLQQQELQQSQAKLQYQADLLTLYYFAGIEDTSIVSLEPPVIELATLPEAENSIFYEKYRVDSLILRNSDALIDYAYKPRIQAYADGGYVTTFTEDYYKHFGTSIGLNITVPIYDGKQRKLQHDRIKIAERTRQGYRDFFKKQYNQQVAQLSLQLRSTQALTEQMNNQMKYVQALIDANHKLLQTGDVKMTDYILAITNYLNARNSIRQNNIARLQLINQINYWNAK